ncbi:unnamed protein product, partial [Mesorhabditis belari]|uniref:UPAR/Ly6 domain-containing protein n=1 Tax=Mesorhabditis belari TaxID=2138241 RepID=A0AAF3ERN1_9BILA
MHRFILFAILIPTTIFALQCYNRETDVVDKKATKGELTIQNCTDEIFCVSYIQDGEDVKLTMLECANNSRGLDDDAACTKVETRTRQEGGITHTTNCCQTDLCNYLNLSSTQKFSLFLCFLSIFVVFK